MGLNDRIAQLEAFLKDPKVRPSKCETCNDTDEIKDAVLAFVAACNEKQTKQPLSSFHTFLCDVYGYDRGHTALRNHIVKCLGGFTRSGR